MTAFAGRELLAAGDVVVPAGVHRGLRLGEVAGRGETGARWLDWASRRHPDIEIRAAALLILDWFDTPRRLELASVDADLGALAIAARETR